MYSEITIIRLLRLGIFLIPVLILLLVLVAAALYTGRSNWVRREKCELLGVVLFDLLTIVVFPVPSFFGLFMSLLVVYYCAKTKKALFSTNPVSVQ